MNPDQQKYKNLSDTRGNRAGIAFFQIFLRIFGVRHACRFVWFVAFFYACFDWKAYRAAKPYLKNRFPKDGWVRLHYRFYRMAISQGQAVLVSYVCQQGIEIPILEDITDSSKKLLAKQGRGLLLLISHTGCWQAALTYLQKFKRPVSVVIQTNRNPLIAKLFDRPGIHIIDNTSAFGGLIDLMAALEQGEIVCIMGDRPADARERSLPLQVFGRTIPVPASPWLLAGRCECPVVFVFSMMVGQGKGIDFYISEPLDVKLPENRKADTETYLPYLRRYADQLNAIAARYPYQIFHYDVAAYSAQER